MHDIPSFSVEQDWRVDAKIEAWRTRPLRGQYPYLYLDAMDLRQLWAGDIQTVCVLVAIGVSAEGYRDTVGVQFGDRQDNASWLRFLSQLEQRGLRGVRLVISDAVPGLVEALSEAFPHARWQHCAKHFCKRVSAAVPPDRLSMTAHMLKLIYIQHDHATAARKVRAVAAALDRQELFLPAEQLLEGAPATLAYYGFPSRHWPRLRTNSSLECVLRQVRRSIRMVGSFPDRHSALALVCAYLRDRFRHIADVRWRTPKYLDMSCLPDVIGRGRTEQRRYGKPG